MTTQPELTAEQLAEIERKFDPESAFRPTGPKLALFVSVVLVAMSVYHFYASGFGLIRELLHEASISLSSWGLVFCCFRGGETRPIPAGKISALHFKASRSSTLSSVYLLLVRRSTCPCYRRKSSLSVLEIPAHSRCSWAALCC